METVSGGNASVISLDSESEVVIDTALNELETVTELVGVNEKLALLITLICVCIIWTVVKNVNKFFDWFF